MDNRIWHIVIQRDGGAMFRELEYYSPDEKQIEYWEKYHEGVVVNVFVTEK